MNSSPSSRPSGSPDEEDEGAGEGGDPWRGDRMVSALEELDILELKWQDLQVSLE
jgi:hypothetical protein